MVQEDATRAVAAFTTPSCLGSSNQVGESEHADWYGTRASIVQLGVDAWMELPKRMCAGVEMVAVERERWVGTLPWGAVVVLAASGNPMQSKWQGMILTRSFTSLRHHMGYWNLVESTVTRETKRTNDFETAWGALEGLLKELFGEVRALLG